jgi:hypothetical protein
MDPMTVLIPLPKFRAVDANGDALSGGKVFVYAAGTTTKIDSYTDAGGGTTNANPVVLDSRGEANIWMPAGVPFKIVLAPSTDTDPPTNAIWTVDNIQAGGASPVVSDTAPASPSFGLLWLDTLANPSTLYIFDNVAWVPVLDLDETNHNSSTGRGIAFGNTSGSVNVYNITAAVRTSLRVGQQLRARVSMANTGAAVMALNSGTPASIFANGAAQLLPGNLPADGIADFVWRGSFWQAVNAVGGRLMRAPQVITSTGSYAKQSGCQAVLVFVTGSGGGGGGDNTVGGNDAGGGGAGGTSIKYILASALAVSETVTVGAGGAAGSGSTGGNGGAGASSSFGSHASATGGGSGIGTAAGRTGGGGGTGSSGDINLTGGSGFSGTNDATGAGNGGTAFWGGGGGGGDNGNGTAGGNYGGGGGGASGNGNNGGAGAGGLVVVFEFW